MSMIIYIKPTCPWCREALAYLDQAGFQYEVRDVLADPVSFDQMREISSQSLTPTLETDGKILADFDTGQLSVFLQEHGISP